MAETLYYLDTSALLPYYRREPVSDAVQHFLQGVTAPVRISALTEVEFASSLARLVRLHETQEVHAVQITELFAQDCAVGLFLKLPVGDAHYKQAKDWLNRRLTTLRTLDALHLACSAAVGAALVTADRTLYASAEYLGAHCKLLA